MTDHLRADFRTANGVDLVAKRVRADVHLSSLLSALMKLPYEEAPAAARHLYSLAILGELASAGDRSMVDLAHIGGI